MRRLLALSLISSALVLGGAGGLAAPAALAAGTSSTATPQPTLNLSNAEQNAADAQSSATQTPAVSTSSTTTSSGLSSTDGVLIALIAILVLGGISFFIWRQARTDANALGHHASDDGMFVSAHAGSKSPRKPRKPSAAERKRRKRGRAR